jgi:hypothetical protein
MVGGILIFRHSRVIGSTNIAASMIRAISDRLIGPPVVIATTLPPDACHARCADVTLEGFFRFLFSAFSRKPVMGEVGRGGLRWRKNSFLRDYLYQVEMEAGFEARPDGAGTRLACRFKGGFLFWLGAVTVPLVFLAVILFHLATALLSFALGSSGVTPNLASAMPIIIIGALLGSALLFARWDRSFLIDTLCATVQGEVVSLAENAPLRPATIQR